MDKLNIRVDEENGTVELIYGATPPLKVSRGAWDEFINAIQNERFDTNPTSLRDEVGVPKTDTKSRADKAKHRS
jgi:hypothetical protein